MLSNARQPDQTGADPRTLRPPFDTRFLVCAVLVLAVAAALYLPAAAGAFVWDDVVLADGSAIGGGESWAECFRRPFLYNYYRPLVSASFMIDRRLWSGNPIGYHLVNLALHLAATLAVMFASRTAFRRLSVSVAAGLLHAVHPVHVGAVAWIGGRTDALGTLWSTLFAWALIGAARSVGDRRTYMQAASVLAFAVAVFTKEQTLFLLPLVPLAYASWTPDRGVQPKATGWWALGPYIIVAAFFLAMGVFLGMPRPVAIEVPSAVFLARIGQSWLHYVLVLFAPSQAVLHTFSLGRYESYGWLWATAGYVLLAGFLRLGIALRKRDAAATWMLAWAGLALLPVSGVFPLPFLLLAPYRACVAGVPVAILLARWLLLSMESLPSGRRLAPAVALSGLSAWLGWSSAVAIPTWRTERALFETMVRYDPEAIVGHYMLAYGAVGEGRDADAVQRLTEMLNRLYRSDAWRSPEGARDATMRDRGVRARVLQNQGRQGDPREFAATLQLQLGYAYYRQSDLAHAATAFRAAALLQPDSAEAERALGWVALATGSLDVAERHAERAHRLEPSAAATHELSAELLERRGRFGEARRERQAAEGR